MKVTSGNPIGGLETAKPSSGSVTVTGWAIDPNVPDPIGVAVYVNGRLASNATWPTSPGRTSRPSTRRRRPKPRVLGHGQHERRPASGLRVRLNVGAGDANPSLGCTTVAVPNANPVGHLESVSGGKGSLTAAGWALDPNTSSSIEVAIYLDGVLALRQTAAAARPDVAAAYPGFGSAHGFALPVTAAAGKHTVCAFGINTGPGDTNTPLGCKASTTS